MDVNVPLMLVAAFLAGLVVGVAIGFFVLPRYAHYCVTIYMLGVVHGQGIAIPVDVCTADTEGVFVAPGPATTPDLMEMADEVYGIYRQRGGTGGVVVRVRSSLPVTGRSGMLALYIGMYAAGNRLDIPPMAGVGDMDKYGQVLPVADVNVKIATDFGGIVFIPDEQCPVEREGDFLGNHIVCVPSLDYVEAYLSRYRE